MAIFREYQETINEIAEKAMSGTYGDNPFEEGSDACKAMLREAYDLIGRFDEGNWFSETGKPIDSPIMEAVRDSYDSMSEREAYDNLPDSTKQSWADEQNEAREYSHRAAPTSKDELILNSDNISRDLGILDKQNASRIASGEKPIYLENSTIEKLGEMGIDANRFKDPDSAPLQTSLLNDNIDATKAPDVSDHISDSFEGQMIMNEVESDGTETDVENIDTTDNEHIQEESGKDIQTSGKVTENSGLIEQPTESVSEQLPADTTKQNGPDIAVDKMASNIFVKYDDDGNAVDLVFKHENGEDTTFTDVLKEFILQDPESFRDIYNSSLEAADKGENPVEHFKEQLRDYIDKNKPSVDNGVDVNAQTGISVSDRREENGSISIEPSHSGPDYQEKYNHHKEKIENINNQPVQWRGDTVKAYHEMAQVFNAYKGGIELKGRVPDILDVTISTMNFLNSNPLETLIINGLRAIINELKSDKVEAETPNMVEVSDHTDKHGFRENGSIDHIPDKDTVDAVGIARKVDPAAGTSFGADMSQVDKRSSPDVTIRTTNPEGINGRGVQVTLDNADKFTFPDIRLVEIKGSSVLVDSFGKVLEVTDNDTKYQAGQTLGGKLDASSSRTGSEALETYARDNNITTEQAKTEITAECKERFASRIEDTYKAEAKAIETHILPREYETRSELNTALNTVERLETISELPFSKDELAKTKEDILSARDCLDKKIDALHERVHDLEASSKKPISRNLNERFSDAVASEKRAVGRSVLTVDLGIDKSKIDSVTQKGVDIIKDKVNAYNATRPEMDRISYDSKTGSLVDRFGINDKGEYVGNKNGQFMAQGVTGPESPEQKAEWIKEHFDATRFEVEQIFGNDHIEKQGVEQHDPTKHVEQPEANQSVDKNGENKIEGEQPKTDTDSLKIETDLTKADVDLSKTTNDQTKIDVGGLNNNLEQKSPDTEITKPTEQFKTDDPLKVENSQPTIEVEKPNAEEQIPPTEIEQNSGLEADQTMQPEMEIKSSTETDALPEQQSEVEAKAPNENPVENTNIEPEENKNIENKIAAETKIEENPKNDTDTSGETETAPTSNLNTDKDDDVAALEDDDISANEVDSDSLDKGNADEKGKDTVDPKANIKGDANDSEKQTIEKENDSSELKITTVNETKDNNDSVYQDAIDKASEHDSSTDSIRPDESSTENIQVSAGNAAEGRSDNEVGDSDETSNQKSAKEASSGNETNDKSLVEKFENLLGDLGDILQRLHDGASIGEAITNHVTDKIDAKIEAIKELLSDIKNADTIGDLIDICGDRLLGFVEKAYTAEIQQYIDVFDLIKDVFEAVIDAFGPENGDVVCSQIMAQGNNPDMSEGMRELVADMSYEARPTIEVKPATTYETGGMEISSSGIQSLNTDTGLTNFEAPEAVSEFVESVQEQIDGLIQKEIEGVSESYEGAVETPNNESSVESPTQDVEQDPNDIEMDPDTLNGAETAIETSEAAGAESVELALIV